MITKQRDAELKAMAEMRYKGSHPHPHVRELLDKQENGTITPLEIQTLDSYRGTDMTGHSNTLFLKDKEESDCVHKHFLMIANNALANALKEERSTVEKVEELVSRLEPSKGKKKPRLEVDRKEAAKTCHVSQSTIKKWDRGESTPAGYPGRYDLVALGMWQQSRASQKLVKKTLNEKNMSGELAINPNQHKVWQTERDAERRSKEEK